MRKKFFTDEARILVRELIRQNVPIPEIADRIGVTVPSLRVLCSRNKVSLQYGKPCKDGMAISASVSHSCYDKLVTEADRLRVTVPRITTMILEIVAKDRLFEALEIDPPERGI